ncbi:MAG: TauD/TfdA family dioxygenase [Myxococcota bacterium]
MSRASSKEPYAITRRGRQQLQDLGDDEIRARLRRDGFVLLRGFGANEQEFAAFVRRFAGRFVPDLRPERPPYGGIQGLHNVDLGYADLLMHFELGSLPVQPQLIAFLCLNPAEQGGETLIADGARVWEQLSADEQATLRALRVTALSRVPRTTWVRWLDPPELGEEEADIERFRAMLPSVPDFSHTFEKAYRGQLVAVLRCTKPTVIERPWLPGRPIVGVALATNHTGVAVVCADDSPIPRSLIRSVGRAIGEVCVPVRWEAGDLAVVDNIRCMHGRTQFSDTRRKVLSLMADLLPEQQL